MMWTIIVLCANQGWRNSVLCPSHKAKEKKKEEYSNIPAFIGKGKVKCTIVQALRLCTGRTVHRGSRGIALLFLDHGTRRGWGVSVTPRPLCTPGERLGTHCAGGWVGPTADLDRCGKSRPHSDSIPTTLPGPLRSEKSTLLSERAYFSPKTNITSCT